jgi:hypothetical protein
MKPRKSQTAAGIPARVDAEPRMNAGQPVFNASQGSGGTDPSRKSSATGGLFPEEDGPGSDATRSSRIRAGRIDAPAVARVTKSRPLRPERFAAPDPAAIRAWFAIASPVLWFELQGRHQLPPTPFPLLPGHLVVNRDLWLAAIERDIAAGPDGPRAKVLVRELTFLRDHINAPRPESQE